jgi:hypothetical protein
MVCCGVLEPNTHDECPTQGLNVQLYWSEKEGQARAKVKWTKITLPTFQGGFEVINLVA